MNALSAGCAALNGSGPRFCSLSEPDFFCSICMYMKIMLRKFLWPFDYQPQHHGPFGARMN